MQNAEIRIKCMQNDVKLFELGERLGFKFASHFSVAMRKEFSPELKAEALELIDKIAREKGNL